MATRKQIDANQRNSLLSCGPKTAEGKSKRSTNSTKPGLSGKGPNVIEARAATLAGRRAARAASVRPQTDEGAHYLDLAVAAKVEPAREPVASRVEDHVVTTVECPPRTQLGDTPTHDPLGRKLTRRKRKALEAKAHRRG